MIASGAWRAKKHQLMADEARCAWNSVHRTRPTTLWIDTVQRRGHDGTWFARAAGAATAGKAGTRRYGRVVD